MFCFLRLRLEEGILKVQVFQYRATLSEVGCKLAVKRAIKT